MAGWHRNAVISLCGLALLVLTISQIQSSRTFYASPVPRNDFSKDDWKKYETVSLNADPNSDSNGDDDVLADNVDIQSLDWIASLNMSVLYREELRKTQLERMKKIQQVCSMVPRLSSQMAGKTNFIKFKSSQVAYCVIPKTGTTNLLRKFCMVLGPNCTRDIGGQNEHVYMIYSGRFTSSLNLELLKPYRFHTSEVKSSEQPENFLFTVVRNPWERLVSVYIEKFISTKEYMSYCNVKKEWGKFQEMKDATNTSWTFRDFMERCVVHQYDARGIPGMNEHFRPQFASGAFCDIRYNFVAKLESFKEDEAAILKQFDRAADIGHLDSEAFKFRKAHEKSGTTKHSAKSYWQTIDPSLMQRLKQIYTIDLKMFGYSDYPLN